MRCLGRLAEAVQAWDATLEGNGPGVLELSGERLTDAYRPVMDNTKVGKEYEPAKLGIHASTKRRLNPKVYDRSKSDLKELSGQDVAGYYKNGEIFIDKSLSAAEYLATLSHELGHCYFADEAKATEFGTHYLLGEKMRAEASGRSAVEIFGKTYSVKDIDEAMFCTKAIKRSIEKSMN